MLKDNFKFHIVGAGRGGTSLLAGLLDYHSELEVGFELFSAAFLMGKEFPYKGPKLFHNRVTAYIAACTRWASQRSQMIWGNKITTEQISGLEDHNIINPEAKIDTLDMFFNTYLKGKAVIFILRDGRTCVNSKVKRTGQLMINACARWQYSVKCFKFFKTQHKNNICIRFEDLLQNPQEHLMRICDFLNISFQKKMLKGTRNKKMVPEYQLGKFDLSKIEATQIPEKCLAKIQADLEYCGYL
jgi:hypothetical protein